MQMSCHGVASFPLWWECAELQLLQKRFVEDRCQLNSPGNMPFGPLLSLCLMHLVVC